MKAGMVCCKNTVPSLNRNEESAAAINFVFRLGNMILLVMTRRSEFEFPAINALLNGRDHVISAV